MTITDIAIIEPTKALAVFTSDAEFSTFYQKIKDEVSGVPVDLSTEAGRKAVASLAFRVTKVKTSIEDAGKKLTEGWREQTAIVTKSRIKMVEELAALAKEVRKPLTDWEEAEYERNGLVASIIEALHAAARIPADDTLDLVRERLNAVRDTVLNAEVLRESLDIAEGARDYAIEQLEAAVVRLTREAADAAELARLRKAEEDRVEAKRVADEAAAAEQAALDAKRVADEAAARAQADQARREQEIKDKAAQDAAAAAKIAADAEAMKAAAAAQAKIDAAEAEAAKLRKAAADRIAAEAKAKAETDARNADREHRRTVNAAAKAALEALGLSPEHAQLVVVSIVAGEIPAVSLAY